MAGPRNPFDNVSWLSRYLSKTAGLPYACSRINVLDDSCSYFLTYEWVASKLIGVLGATGVIAASALTVLLVFYTTLRVLGNPALAGVTSLIYASSPAVVFWSTPSNMGHQVLSGILATLILLALYVNEKAGGIRGALLLGLSGLLAQVLNPAGWLLVEGALIGLAAEFAVGVRGRLNRVAALLLALSSIPALVAPGLGNLFPIIPLSTSLLLLLVDTLMQGRPIPAGTRITLIAVALTASVALPAPFILTHSGGGYTAVFIKSYNPPLDYGVLAATGLIGLIVLSRSRLLSEMPGVKTAIISSTVLLLIAAMLDPTLVVAEAFLLALLTSLALYVVAEYSWGFRRGAASVLYRAAAIAIVLGVVSGGVLLSVAQTRTQPFIYTYDLQGYTGLGTPVRNESAWLNALSALKQAISNSTGSRILVLSYWGYTYWIQRFLADAPGEVYTLAHDLGGDRGRYLVSAIMLSSEETAARIVSNVSSEVGASRRFIVVSYLASVRLIGGRSSGAAYLGVAVPVQTQEYYENIYYAAAGDLSRLVLYAATINTSYLSYVNIYNARSGYELPLAWSKDGYNSLLAQLAVDSLQRLGYNVYNQLYSYSQLSSSVRLFKPVAVESAPVLKVSGLYSEYQIIHVVAVYELP